MIHRVASEMFQQVLTQVQLSVITVLVRFGGGGKNVKVTATSSCPNSWFK